MSFTTISSEGALLPADLLEEIAAGSAAGQRPADFGFSNRVDLNNEIAAAWSDARAYWTAFQRGLQKVAMGESGAGATRDLWMLPLLRTLGFQDISYSRSAATIAGHTYAISHRLGSGDDGVPILIEGSRNSLDKRPPSGRPRISPHSLVQEYLNRSEHLWGLVTNGDRLRILRNSARLTRPAYLEFDLKQLMETERFGEFQLLFRVVHRSRWPQNIHLSHECLLETYYQQGIESGGRIRERLRSGVEQAVRIFGQGFLDHPDNGPLRNSITERSLATGDYYREILRLIYRFLFLMVSEERNLVGPDPKMDRLRTIYERHYSISRFRHRAEGSISRMDRHQDLWEGAKQTFLLYSHSDHAVMMGIDPLNGDLFGPDAIPRLMASSLNNSDFLAAMASLSVFRDEKTIRRVNYAHLDVEELGSVYESLLDYHPLVNEVSGRFQFTLASGNERKSTGSYYTRPELVAELVKSGLEPIMQERLAAAHSNHDKEKALLSLRILDPAAGSGHFLLAAARRVGRELAKIRLNEEQPTPTQFRAAVRDVIRRCVYGVDKNPLAVDLCKVALWLEGHNRGMPLTFLDHHIRLGDSLIGIDSLDRLKKGIPEEAFQPVAGDVKDAATTIKKFNRRELKDLENQPRLNLGLGSRFSGDMKQFVTRARQLSEMSDADANSVNLMQEAYQSMVASREWHTDRTAADIWTAAFFWPLTDGSDPSTPTTSRLMEFLENPGSCQEVLVDKAGVIARNLRFFHWPLEFPEVFDAGGFDVVLGNPPWERIKLQEQEFFAVRAPEIAQAPNKAARDKMTRDLKENNPDLAKEFQHAKHDAEAGSLCVRNSGRFPLTAVGDVNTYALFAELSTRLAGAGGRTAIIVPTGIATDDTCKNFFSDLNERRALVSLFDFENREALFPGVHRSYKFSLLTTSGRPVANPVFSFFLTRTDHLDDKIRRFNLSADDLALINPNTRTTPVFRTKVDAELTRKIYQRVPVLVNERTGENAWGVRFVRLFDMANDSHLFHTEPGPGRVPLYEAKMIWQYDHRFGTFDGVTSRSSTHIPTPTFEQYADPHFTVRPWYWVDKEEVEARLADWKHGWLIGFRDIARSTDERTLIASVIPRVGVGHKMPLIMLGDLDIRGKSGNFIANLNCVPFDYVTRQKVGGVSMSYFIIKQLPLLEATSYRQSDLDFITPRVLELIYTSSDLQPFAHDCGYDGPPFRWDEDRRAVLRAELDAYYAHLYGLNRDELRYILDPQDVYGPDFPGETFRVLKEKDLRRYGEYRTRRLVLEAWDRLFG